jgi:hypothetical protein
MKTQLTTTLQTLVLGRMAPRFPEMEDQEVAQWMEQLPKIRSGIFKVLRKTMFGYHSNELIGRHLTQLRKECTFLLDALHGYPECTGSRQQLHQMISDDLMGILLHLRLNYNTYLDANLAMPKLIFDEAVGKLEVNMALMVSAMKRYHVDQRLQSLLTGNMTTLIKNELGTWHQVAYLEHLQDAIMRLFAGHVVSITDQLRNLLLRMNFNTSDFLTYCKEEIEGKMAGYYELSTQYDCLFHYQRELMTLSGSGEFCGLEPGGPELKYVLLEYVNAGLRMLNHTHRMSIETKVPAAAGQPCRLPVSVSVDVLAYLFRLLMTVGVAKGNKTALQLFISRSFQTPGIGEAIISTTSIESKYRQVVKNTATSVRSILIKMLKQLDDDFK